MPLSELEIVKYPKIKHLKMFVNRLRSKDDHVHNDFELFLVLNGEGSVKINGNEQNIKKGDLFLVNSGDVHSYHKTPSNVENTGDPTILFVQVSNHFVREYFPQIRTTLFESCNLKEKFPKLVYEIACASLAEAAMDYFSDDFTNLTLSIVSSISLFMSFCYKYVNHEIINEGQKQKLKRKNARLERIISYIDANFETQIRLEDLASAEDLSVTHFSHLFSSTFGVTFQEYVNLKRLEQCLRLMGNKEKTLLEISYESGFSDPKYMNKMFMKKFGCTPKEYRKSMGTETLKLADIVETETELIFSDVAASKIVNEYFNEEVTIYNDFNTKMLHDLLREFKK